MDRNSKTRYNRFSCMMTSSSDTMLAWVSSFRIVISRMAVDGTPSSSFSNRIFLRATREPTFFDRALYTTPYVPAPRRPSHDYCQSHWSPPQRQLLTLADLFNHLKVLHVRASAGQETRAQVVDGWNERERERKQVVGCSSENVRQLF